jgi:hypothetical protein
MSEPDDGMTLYLDFIGRVQATVQRIVRSFDNILSVGHISSRLLRDPTTVVLHSQEEQEAHIVGYLKALLSLGYCGVRRLVGAQFHSTNIYSEGLKTGSIENIIPLVNLVQNEIANS